MVEETGELNAADEGTTGAVPEEEDPQQYPIQFKNYKPYDTKLKKYVVPPSDDDYIQSMRKSVVLDSSGTPIEMNIIKRELALLKSEEINIVPKKSNYDLKGQVEKRLSKLKKRTQKAIVEILREKLAAQNDDSSDDDK